MSKKDSFAREVAERLHRAIEAKEAKSAGVKVKIDDDLSRFLANDPTWSRRKKTSDSDRGPTTNPTIRSLIRMAEAADVTVGYLLGETLTEPSPEEQRWLAKMLEIAAQMDEVKGWVEQRVRQRPRPDQTNPAADRAIRDVTRVTPKVNAITETTQPRERSTGPVPADPDVAPMIDLYRGDANDGQEPERGRHGDKNGKTRKRERDSGHE